MKTIKPHYFKTQDGRTISYAEYGDPSDIPIFYAHGGPGSRLEGAIFDDKAREYGFRLIATDRPGMGESTFQPARILLDYPRDISQLADELLIDKFGVMGWSGGGAHTTVCSYAIPDRLLFNISLSGYTNFAELPGAANMLQTKIDQLAVGWSMTKPKLASLMMDVIAFAIKYMPNLWYTGVTHAGNEADKKINADQEFREHLLADQKEAVRFGGKGLTVDAAVQYVDWGFKLADIPGKVIIFHGDEDKSVPLAYGQHLAENIPNCELNILEGEGHLYPVTHQDMIFGKAKAETKTE